MEIPYEEIKETPSDMCGCSSTIYTHPSFGMLGFSRIHGGDRTLFGSSIKHHDRISLVIKRGEEARSLHGDHYFGLGGKIIEVEMSYSQFAEAITSLNVGDGVPCTIRYTEKDGYIPLIQDKCSKREQFTNEFSSVIRQAMSQVQDVVNDIQSTLDNKRSLGVKERKELVSKLRMVKSNIGSNLVFCAEQFNEQMDKTVMEAKGEIESFYQNKVNSIASEALIARKNEIKKLDNPVKL